MLPEPLAGVVRAWLPSSLPFVSRANYRRELTTACFMPTALACVEGGVLGVIASQSYHADPMVVALISGAPALANITSFVWARLAHGRDRVRFVGALQVGVLLCVALIALTPFTQAGQWMLAGAALAARSLMAGIITARADLWVANYPRSARFRVTGRLTIVTTLVMTITSLAIGLAMRDAGDSPHGFRWVYGASVLLAMIGVFTFSRVRWRGGRRIVARERSSSRGADGRHAVSARRMIDVLRSDKAYRRFMAAQFVLGVPSLAADAPFILALRDVFALGQSESIALTQVIPTAVMIVSIPMWARVLDRMHIVHFRVYHSWVFVAANLLMGLAVLWESHAALYASRIVIGAAMGGGTLAWNLGHHDFARQGMGAVYMGIHVTLTGVRGAFAPFLGTLLYQGAALGGAARWDGLRGWAFILFTGMSMGACWMFWTLYRDIRRGTARPAGDSV